MPSVAAGRHEVAFASALPVDDGEARTLAHYDHGKEFRPVEGRNDAQNVPRGGLGDLALVARVDDELGHGQKPELADPPGDVSGNDLAAKGRNPAQAAHAHPPPEKTGRALRPARS